METYVIISKVRVHVVDAVVHNRCCYVLSGETLCPRRLDVEVESRLSAVLADVFLQRKGTSVKYRILCLFSICPLFKSHLLTNVMCFATNSKTIAKLSDLFRQKFLLHHCPRMD